jgi:hypothetical protein
LGFLAFIATAVLIASGKTMVVAGGGFVQSFAPQRILIRLT